MSIADGTVHTDDVGSGPVWGAQGADQPAILEFVRAHLDPCGCGLLPGGDDLPGGENDPALPSTETVRWAPGARDGVAALHVAAGVTDTDIGELIALIGGAINNQFSPAEYGELYDRLRAERAVAIADELVGAVARSDLPPSGVAELGRRLAGTGHHAEAVKVGIALLGLTGTVEDRDLLLTLGRHEEFTLFCAAALRGSEAEPDRALWSLARSVDGWGRIHAVKRLWRTGDEEIQDWIVRGGFRNKVMNEYLAYIAATTGRLLERLEADPDEELAGAAGEIISALIAGGPAQDIDDYPDAPQLLEDYLRLISDRAPQPEYLAVVDDIRGFLEGGDRWPERYQRGWTAKQRAGLLVACEQILSRQA